MTTNSSTTLLYASGFFPYLPILDSSSCQEVHRVSTSRENWGSTQLFWRLDPARKLVAVGANNADPDIVSIYDVDLKTEVVKCKTSHRRAVTAVESISYPSSSSRVISADGNWSGHDSGRMTISHAETGESVFTFETVPCVYRLLTAPIWSRSEVYVCGHALDDYIMKFDFARGSKLRGYHDVSSQSYSTVVNDIWAIASDVDHNLLFAGGCLDTKIRAWSRNEGECLFSFLADSASYAMTFDPDRNQLLLGDSHGVITVWDPRKSDERVDSLAVARFYINDIRKVSDDLFASASSDQSVAIWNLSKTHSKTLLHCDMDGIVHRVAPLNDEESSVEERRLLTEEIERISYSLQKLPGPFLVVGSGRLCFGPLFRGVLMELEA